MKSMKNTTIEMLLEKGPGTPGETPENLGTAKFKNAGNCGKTGIDSNNNCINYNVILKKKGVALKAKNP